MKSALERGSKDLKPLSWKPFFESWMLKYKKKGDEFAVNAFTLAMS